VSQYSENIIIGAGAAGLFCAAQLAKLGKSVTVFDNGKKTGDTEESDCSQNDAAHTAEIIAFRWNSLTKGRNLSLQAR